MISLLRGVDGLLERLMSIRVPWIARYIINPAAPRGRFRRVDYVDRLVPDFAGRIRHAHLC